MTKNDVFWGFPPYQRLNRVPGRAETRPGGRPSAGGGTPPGGGGTPPGGMKYPETPIYT